MPGAPAIRPVADDDIDDIVRLWRDCDLVRPWNDPQADIARCRSAADAALFVTPGAAAGQVWATAMAGWDGHRGWLYYVAVDPARRSEGLGRRMVRHAEAWLAGRGAPKVELMIRTENAAVAAFYAAIGYETQQVTVMARWL